MKIFYHILAFVVIALGVVCLFKSDQETFRYSAIIGLLLTILAEVHK